MPAIRIGLLGAGDIAERHLRGLEAAGGVTLVTVCDPVRDRAESLARRHSFERVAASEREVVAGGDIDLVLILTPHACHAGQAIEALCAGKHVICEKPMACRTADCDAMLDAARRSGRRLFVTHSLRAEFFFRVAAARLRSGALGRLTLASFRWFTDEITRLDDPAHWKGTIEVSGGGVLIDGGCHVADLGNAFLGRPRRVQALAGLLVASRPGLGEDTAVFSVEYESGALASVALSFVAGEGLRQDRFACGLDLDLFGTQGHIEAGYRIREASFRRWCREHRRGQADTEHVDDGRSSGSDLDRWLIEALRGEREPPLTALDARNAVAVVEAAYRSLQSGRSEEVEWQEA
jgi:predicted dehydrogenase